MILLNISGHLHKKCEPGNIWVIEFGCGGEVIMDQYHSYSVTKQGPMRPS